ncbi:MAG TPA: hypothetical protein VFZ81_10485, partial [Burkholderiales bacterium]
MKKSALQEALKAAVPGRYAEALERVVPCGTQDAKALAEALGRLNSGQWPSKEIDADLHALTAVFQEVDDKGTAEALRAHALPELIRAFDRRLSIDAANPDPLLFVLKILAMYGGAEALSRIVQGVRRF